MAKDFLPKVITWFRLDEHVKRLKEFVDSLTTRIETLENAPSGIESVSGDGVDNTDPLNPVILASGVETVSGDLVDNTDPLNPAIIDAPSDTNQYARQDGAWELIVAGGASELEKLNEGNGDGWRLLGRNPALFGNIGLNAIDFSDSDDLSSTRGATGAGCFATGLNNIVNGTRNAIIGGSANNIDVNTLNSTILGGENNTMTATEYGIILGGVFNSVTGGRAIAGGFANTAKSFTEVVLGSCSTNYTPVGVTTFWEDDRAFNIGVGADTSTRRDGFTVFKNARSKFGGVAQLKNYTVGTLPVGTEGDTAYVTDATAPTYLGALVGGGAVKCPVFFNGVAWVSH